MKGLFMALRFYQLMMHWHLDKIIAPKLILCTCICVLVNTCKGKSPWCERWFISFLKDLKLIEGCFHNKKETYFHSSLMTFQTGCYRRRSRKSGLLTACLRLEPQEGSCKILLQATTQMSTGSFHKCKRDLKSTNWVHFSSQEDENEKKKKIKMSRSLWRR